MTITTAERPPHHDRHPSGGCARRVRQLVGGDAEWLDRLAAGGLRFSSARAHNVLTLPSHANILTGRLPPEHGVRDNAGFRLAAGEATLATRLEARGFRTGAFVSGFPLDSRFGLSRGFDVYDDAFVDATARPAFLEQERAGTETVAAGTALAAGTSNERRTVVRLDASLRAALPVCAARAVCITVPRDPYAGEVAATDAALAPLLQPILDAGKATDTLVIVTADHGESLGDHGEATHGIFAYEATLRVPLIVYSPPLTAPAVVDAPASHIDILPTILEALGMPEAAGLRGRSLLRPSRDNDRARFTYFEALSGWLNRGWAPLSGVVADGIKYIDLPIPELYRIFGATRRSRTICRPRGRSRSPRIARCSNRSRTVTSGASTRPLRSRSGCGRWATLRRRRQTAKGVHGNGRSEAADCRRDLPSRTSLGSSSRGGVQRHSRARVRLRHGIRT